MRVRALESRLFVCAFATIAVLSLNSTAAAQQICNSGVCVTTWQQDTGVPDIGTSYVYRTGENLMESTIVASNLSSNTFGQL